MRSKVPRNKSFKQAVGAGLGHGQGSPSGERRRRRKSLEEQLVRNTEAVAEGVATLSKSSLGSSRSLASSRSSSRASSRRGSTATIEQAGRGGSLADLAGGGDINKGGAPVEGGEALRKTWAEGGGALRRTWAVEVEEA